jgi:polyhydroxyalkanoate synthase
MFDLDLIASGFGLRETWNDVRDMNVLPAWTRGLKTGASASEEVFARGNLRLVRYLPKTEIIHKTPIVIIPSLINRHYILDLLPDQSLIGFLLNEGFEVYLIEWLAPQIEDRHLTLDRLSTHRIARALDRVAERSMTGRFHLLGHCLGGTFAILEAAQRQERVQSLTLLTTPVDFAKGGKLSLWAKETDLDIEAIIDAYGNMPWPLMQAGFHMLRPSISLAKWRKAFSRMKDVDFLVGFLSLEMWANDGISLLGNVYQFLVRKLYQENALVLNRFEINGQLIDLRRIQMPILDVIATDDHIVPPQMRWPRELNSQSTTRVDLVGGHVGALVGRRARETFWPELSRWLQKVS